MKVFNLMHNCKICGFRFYFEDMRLAYDITLQQFKTYFEDTNKDMFMRLTRNCGSLELVYDEDKQMYITDDERHHRYKVLNGETNDSIPSWLSYVLHFDVHMDYGSMYKCKECTTESLPRGTVRLEEVDMINGRVIVSDTCGEQYCFGIRLLERM